MGAWIEILSNCSKGQGGQVAPLVGAWIEIIRETYNYLYNLVAPLVGAWIEIDISSFKVARESRSSRGSVD